MVKTGDRLGSSTDAEIWLQIFGEKGKTKLLPLKTSQTHRLPFRKSNTDVFEIETFDVGPVKAIQLGHNQNDIGIKNNIVLEYILLVVYLQKPPN